MKNLRLYIPLLVFLVVVGLAFVPLMEGKDLAQPSSPLVGKPVPEFSISSALEGKGISAASLKNAKGPIVVNFFASWCLECHKDQPVLEKLSRETKAAVYGISYKDTKPQLKKWLDAYGNPFAAIGFDADGRAAINWGVYGVPETFIIDKAGIVRYRLVGPMSESLYRETVKPLLEKLKS